LEHRFSGLQLALPLHENHHPPPPAPHNVSRP
jgi:hypothetical protein